MSWLKIPDSKYPRKPVKAAVITFIVLMVWCGLFLPFNADVRDRWVWLVGYCGALSIVVIGIIRFGPRAVVLLVIAGLLASAPAVIGIAWLLLMAGPIEETLIWVAVSRYLLFGVIAGAILWAIYGWILYFTSPKKCVKSNLPPGDDLTPS